MKRNQKVSIALLSVSIGMLGISVFAFAQAMAIKAEYQLSINGERKEFSAPLVTYEDRAYLPIREFSEMLGLDVAWNEKDKTIEITGDLNAADTFNQFGKDELQAILKFKHLHVGDELSRVYEEFGEAQDVGSGILILSYPICENVHVMVGSGDQKTVWYAKLMIGNELLDLIPPKYTDADPDEASDTVEKTIQTVTDEMERKGWSNVRAQEGQIDSSAWSSLLIPPDEAENHMQMYTVTGEADGQYDNPITIVAKIAVSPETPNGRVYKLFYVSKSGRYYEADEILQANDAELMNQMYSY